MPLKRVLFFHFIEKHFVGFVFQDARFGVARNVNICCLSFSVRQMGLIYTKFLLLISAFIGAEADPIPESNIGSRMLQSMGWSPGQGLGADGAGIRTPITACLRPRRQGFGSVEQPSTSWDGHQSGNSNTLTAEHTPGSKVELHTVSSEHCS